MRYLIGLVFLVSVSTLASGTPFNGASTNLDAERTCFQTGAPFSGEGDIGPGVSIVYGIHNWPKRIHGWRAHGYHVQMMTGSAWGGYQDYLYGKYDRSNPVDEVQEGRNGKLGC